MKKLIFYILTLIASVLSCQQPAVLKKINRTLADTLRNTIKTEDSKLQKPDMQLSISRDEKSKDSNYRRRYFSLYGNVITMGEDIKGRFAGKKEPEKSISLSEEKMAELKQQILKLGLVENYKKNYGPDKSTSPVVLYYYFFKFEATEIIVSGSGEREDDPAVLKIQKLGSYLENLFKE